MQLANAVQIPLTLCLHALLVTHFPPHLSLVNLLKCGWDLVATIIFTLKLTILGRLFAKRGYYLSIPTFQKAIPTSQKAMASRLHSLKTGYQQAQHLTCPPLKEAAALALGVEHH